jgi:hypothetical protein
MADDFRSRDPQAPAAASASHEDLADPLAELARLIGQREPRSGGSGDAAYEAGRYDDAPPASELEWVAGGDRYAEPGRDTHDGYAPHPSEGGAWPHDDDDRGKRDVEAPPARQYAALAPAFDDMPDRGEHRQPAFDGQSPRYEPPPHDSDPSDDRPPYAAQGRRDDDAVQDEYEPDEHDGRAPRRSGTILILAVLGLAVLGTAGALGYRAMFGGAMVSGFPPLIKPADGPIKVQPSQEKQAGKPGQSDTANQGAGERLVEHQEQPVDIQSANPPVPRVVNTIPVVSNATVAPLPGDAPPPADANPPAPPQPGPIASLPADLAPPPAVANPPAAQAPQPAAPGPAASGAKPVHTLIIRPGQSANANANPASAAAPPPAHVTKPHEQAPREPRQTARAGGPLSIVPSPDGDVHAQAPARTHVATRTPEPPEATSAGAGSGGGGYAVQVSSQRSEAEAEAAFRALQAKFPQELGGRHPMVRRADLGAKGVYYRALVGPFASGQQATELCSKLKAAGGSCIIQRN